jgi:hypothetical protein
MNSPQKSRPSTFVRLPRVTARACLGAALLFAALFAGPVNAEFLQPVGVRVTNGEGSQEALIDGQGLDDAGLGTPDSVHDRNAGSMWSAVGSVRESAIFDLGKAVNLTKVYLWNYNAGDATDVGMKDVEVQVSSDTNLGNTAAVFNTIAKISLKEGGDKAQVFPVVGTGVRLVRLKGLSNWGQGYTVGLAEVRFESGDVTGNVPSLVLNSPREGEEIALGTDIVVDARITDKDGVSDLAKVELFDGETLVTNRVATTFTATLKGAAKGDHVLRLVATDKSGKVAWVSANITVRELVADRIEKIDDTRDEGSTLGKIRYVGSWNLAPGNASDPRFLNNDHYNLGTGNRDYFEVRFKGVKIDVFATVASHHGTGMASIDGGPEVKVVYKAAQRKEQVLVWSSPILANKEHVLKIRVVGDGVVTADRFDISVSDRPDVATAEVQSIAFDRVVLRMTDVGASVVDPVSVSVSLDGLPITVSAQKSAGITTITVVPATPFAPGSVHTAVVQAKDATGASVSRELAFTLPAPYFPLTGLGGPAGTAGNWGVRQIWNAGRIDAVVLATDAALAATRPGFAGKVHETQVPFINFALSSNPGSGGIMPDDQPLPAEAVGLTPNDFAIVARARVKVPRSGDWTIGVHTDDGFALRFIGAPFDRVSGNGLRDEDFPEYMAFPTESGNSNTRGVLKGLRAGEYEIEFIGFQRVGGAQFEIYAAEGAFAEDSESDQWQLIGAPGGWEILSSVSFRVTRIAAANGQVVIDFDSPVPSGGHQLQESTDLRNWTATPGAVFSTTAGNGVRATAPVSGATARFYRVGR